LASLYTASQKPSPLFRYIDGNGGTIIFDEAEGINVDPEKYRLSTLDILRQVGEFYLQTGITIKYRNYLTHIALRFSVSINNLPDTVDY